jgi:hypothetical protein
MVGTAYLHFASSCATVKEITLSRFLLSVHRAQNKCISWAVNPMVDPGSFSGIEGYVLHFIPAGFLPQCPKTTPKYQKISYSYKPQCLLSSRFFF